MSSDNKKIISVVAPSSAGKDPAHLESSIKYYSDLGFQVSHPQNMLDFSNTFHANTDEFRSQTLIDALTGDAKIIWSWKGGYGASKIIPSLLNVQKPAKEKFFIGFSDITALHIFLNQHWGWKTIHGASFSNPVRKEFDIENTLDILDLISGKKKDIIINDLVNLTNPTKEISGKITGGNLSMLEQSIGTAWQVDMTNKIVILEDVDERGYRVDRMLDHLLQAGILNKAKAVVFGQFTGSKESDNTDNIQIAIDQFCKKVSYPVFRTNLIGHDRRNIPFVYGAQTIIKGNTNETILNSLIINP